MAICIICCCEAAGREEEEEAEEEEEDAAEETGTVLTELMDSSPSWPGAGGIKPGRLPLCIWLTN